MVKGIQVIGMVVGLYLIVQTYRNYRKGSNNIRRTIFWLILWSTMTVLFSNPSLSEFALPILSTQDALVSVIVLGMLLIFILITHIWQHINRMEQQFVELAQNLAINDYIKAARTEASDDVDE
ncbi:MAG: DUF2304 family protein [Candidatus Hodarchaeota archaeon]